MQDIRCGQRVWYETSFDGIAGKRYGTAASNVVKNFYSQDEVKVKWDDNDTPTYHLASCINPVMNKKDVL